jgi:hypothetical protein
MNGMTKRVMAVAVLVLAEGAALAGNMRVVNLYINRAYAVNTFNERRATGVKIQNGEEIIRLASDGLQFMVENTGPAAVLDICGEVYDMNGQHVIGSGTISTKNAVPTGMSTLIATDFRSDTHFNVDPGYNLALEDKYRNSAGQDILKDLLATTYRFKVWACPDPSAFKYYYFTITEPPHDPVRLSRPSDRSAVCPQGLMFAWFQTMLEGQPAAKYRLEVFEGEDGVNRIFDSGDIPGTSLIYPANARQLDRDRTYVWRVTATDSLNVRRQASQLYRFTADCAGSPRRFLLSDFESELRRSRPDVFASLGNLRLNAAESPSLGTVETAKFQRMIADLATGKAKIQSATVVLPKEKK